MANDFSRNFMPVSFETSGTSKVDMYLRIADVAADRWDNNAKTLLDLQQLNLYWNLSLMYAIFKRLNQITVPASHITLFSFN